MDPVMEASNLRNERAEITGRILEAQFELSKIRRKWLVEGVQTPIAVRATLDCEVAGLELERHAVDRKLALVDKARRESLAGEFHARLVEALKSRGMSSLVEEVRAAALASRPGSTRQGDTSAP